MGKKQLTKHFHKTSYFQIYYVLLDFNFLYFLFFSFKGQKGWIKAIHWKSKRRFVQNVTCLKNKKQNNNKQNRLKITWRVLLYEWKITSCGSNFCINFRNIFQVHSVLKHINYIMYNMDQRNINKYNLKTVCSTYSHFFRIQPYHIRQLYRTAWKHD